MSTCGMNEKGVVTALASTVSYPIKNDEGLKTVFVTQWMRKILDNADEAHESCFGVGGSGHDVMVLLGRHIGEDALCVHK